MRIQLASLQVVPQSLHDGRHLATQWRSFLFPILFSLFTCFGLAARADGPPAATQRDAGGIGVKVVNFRQYKAEIGRHQGKVVIVDTWATWCPHCVRSFPHFVNLHRRLRRRDVRCVSFCLETVSGGNVQYTLPRIRRFLETQGSDTENLVAQESFTELSSPEKLGVSQIPTVMVYGPDGKLARSFTPSQNQTPTQMYESVARYVDELLDAK